jgi:hypothetical protein
MAELEAVVGFDLKMKIGIVDEDWSDVLMWFQLILIVQ